MCFPEEFPKIRCDGSGRKFLALGSGSGQTYSPLKEH